MTNERFFRTLSVALLGLMALTVVPNSKAESAHVKTAEIEALPAAFTSEFTPQFTTDFTTVREVEEVNERRFSLSFPASDAGDAPNQITRDTTNEISPIHSFSASASDVDPNL